MNRRDFLGLVGSLPFLSVFSPKAETAKRAEASPVEVKVSPVRGIEPTQTATAYFKTDLALRHDMIYGLSLADGATVNRDEWFFEFHDADGWHPCHSFMHGDEPRWIVPAWAGKCRATPVKSLLRVTVGIFSVPAASKGGVE